MAKRPNPKKEKALRNKAYARKFSKKQSGYSFRGNRSYNKMNNSQNKEEMNNNNPED